MKQAKRLTTAVFAIIIIFNISVAHATPKEGDEAIENPISYAEIPVVEIDIGDFVAEMYVGDTQLLMVTFFPSNNTEQNAVFMSSNTDVATINQTGRIRAVKIGLTEISVSTKNVTQKFTLRVIVKAETPYVDVVDIDLGDFQEELYLGKSQLLSPTILPTNATDQKVDFYSSNPKVATINMMGRILAHSAGQTTIRVSAGAVIKSLKTSNRRRLVSRVQTQL